LQRSAVILPSRKRVCRASPTKGAETASSESLNVGKKKMSRERLRSTFPFSDTLKNGMI